MSLQALNITENYQALEVLTQAELNAAMQSIEDWVVINNKDLTQLALDVFGSYTFNNDGLQALTPSFFEQAVLLTADNLFEGHNTFQGATTFSDTVDSDSTFSSSGQMRSRPYRVSSDQAIPNNVATSISCSAHTYDVGGLHSVSVNQTKIFIPSGGSGIYKFNGQVTFEANATGRREAYIYKNGAEIARFTVPTASAGFVSTVQVSCDDSCAQNDYFEMFVLQTSGGNLNALAGQFTTFFSCIKMW